MDMQMKLHYNRIVYIDTSFLEELLFKIGDLCNIRIAIEPSLLTGAALILGGVLGALAGGRMGAAVGASLAGAIGYGACNELTLREAWEKFKDQLKGLRNIVLEFLQNLDHLDYFAAANIIMASLRRREELCTAIIEYIVSILGQKAYRAFN